MHRPSRLAALALCAVATASALCRADQPTTEKTDPKLPDVPGSFHAYNAYNAPGRTQFKGRYHSPVAEFGLEPMVMLFTREVEFGDPLKDLLKQIDNAVEKNPSARLHAFLVVQSDDLPEVVGVDSDPAVADKNDDRRIELAQKLEDQAKGLMLQHVDVLLAGKADLEKYKLDDAGFAFFLFQRAKVTASKVLKKDDKLTPDVTAEIMKTLAEKGGATRK
jgi:hypothetical protein